MGKEEWIQKQIKKKGKLRVKLNKTNRLLNFFLRNNFFLVFSLFLNFAVGLLSESELLLLMKPKAFLSYWCMAQKA